VVLLCAGLIVIFFIAKNINLKNNPEEKKSVTEEIPENITKAVDANIDEEVLKTLQKEELPKDISGVRSLILPVPAFKQTYIRSCEETALRMVLFFYDIKTNDMEIVKRVGYDPHPWDKKNNLWDDPDKMFVGSIDDPNKNGYGTFAPSIATAARTFGRDSESYLGVSAQFLAQQIYSGHPVIVWGFSNVPPFVKYFWNTKEGKKITAYRGEHTRVVVGVYGEPSNPLGFLVNDPLTGAKNEYWGAERLLAQMNIYGNLTNQAVVVK